MQSTRASRLASLDDNRLILLESVLGLNDNVEPNPRSILRQRRNQKSSEESTRTIESEAYTHNAFHVSHHIGALKHYNADYARDPKRAMED